MTVDSDRKRRTRASWCLAAVFAFALIMGPGPGMALANHPVIFLGLPALYVWGLLWFLVEVAVVVLAYLFVWTDADDSEKGPHR